jgi:hypothetical protein
MIIIADIIPFLFIYPYISDFTSYLCMPVHWNTGQYLIFYAIILKIFTNNIPNKFFINAILFSIISFCIYVLGFLFFFFAKNSDYTNYFNNSNSIIIFFFAPMILFIKEYSIQKIFIKSEVNPFTFIFIIWIFEEIIYLILRIYFVSFKNIFFGGIKIQNIYVTLLSVYNDIGSYFFLAYNLNLTVKGLGKSFSHIIWWGLNIFSFWMIYLPVGYVLLSTLAAIIEFAAYYVFMSFIKDEDIFMEMYKDESSQQLIEENNTNPNININMGNHNYSNDQLNINNDNPIPHKNNYNFDERIKKLEDENTMIKSDKKRLEDEIDSLRTANNILKIKNAKLTQDNEKLIADIVEKETEIEILKKEN